MTLIVHHLNNSRSQRILWLIEELGLDYELTSYQRDAVSNLAPDSLLHIHPLGKSPVIELDGQLISESGAIVEFLCRRFNGEWLLKDPNDAAYIRFLEFFHFAEGSAMTPILLNLYLSRLGDAAGPVAPRIESQLTAHFKYMEDALENRDFFLGDDLSAADIMMSFPAEITVMGHAELYPNLSKFVANCHQRDAWKRARDRGGAYFIY